MSAPIGLQVGETYEDGGRTMIVDKVLEDGSYIAHVEGYKEPAPQRDERDPKAKLRAEIEAELREELEISIKSELEEKIRAEIMAEFGDRLQPVTGNPTSGDATPANSDELKCRYCGKPYKDASWLEAHEAKCPSNPENAGK